MLDGREYCIKSPSDSRVCCVSLQSLAQVVLVMQVNGDVHIFPRGKQKSSAMCNGTQEWWSSMKLQGCWPSDLYPGPIFISWNKQVQIRSRITKQLIGRRLAPTCTAVLSQQLVWWCNTLKTTIILLSSNMYRLVTRILTAAGCRDAGMNITGKANPNL